MDSTDLRALVACPDCDALYRRPELTVGSTATCVRCGAVLLRERHDSIGSTLAYTLAGLILFVPANVYTFFSFGLAGRSQPSTITGGAKALADAGYAPLGALIFFTSVLAPLLILLLCLYVCLPLKLGRCLPWTHRALALYERLQPWGMLSVYLIGALVAITKMSDYGSMPLGKGFFAFLALLFVVIKAQASLEPDDVWPLVEERR